MRNSPLSILTGKLMISSFFGCERMALTAGSRLMTRAAFSSCAVATEYRLPRSARDVPAAGTAGAVVDIAGRRLPTLLVCRKLFLYMTGCGSCPLPRARAVAEDAHRLGLRLGSDRHGVPPREAPLQPRAPRGRRDAVRHDPA